MTRDSALEPCPFCGKGAIRFHKYDDIRWDGVMCVGCGASMQTNNKAACDVAWNRRMPSDAASARREALEDAARLCEQRGSRQAMNCAAAIRALGETKP